jgi:hypothetical protein
MPKKQGKDGFSFTVCGEFFPEVLPAFRCAGWSQDGKDLLVTEMQLFCACMRWAFNRLLEGTSRDEVRDVREISPAISACFGNPEEGKAADCGSLQKPGPNMEGCPEDGVGRFLLSHGQTAGAGWGQSFSACKGHSKLGERRLAEHCRPGHL